MLTVPRASSSGSTRDHLMTRAVLCRAWRNLFDLPSVPGPALLGGGFQFPLGCFRNNTFWLGADGRQCARGPSSAAHSGGGLAGNYLRELLTLRRQFFDLNINGGNRHLDMLRGIAAS